MDFSKIVRSTVYFEIGFLRVKWNLHVFLSFFLGLRLRYNMYPDTMSVKRFVSRYSTLMSKLNHNTELFAFKCQWLLTVSVIHHVF